MIFIFYEDQLDRSRMDYRVTKEEAGPSGERLKTSLDDGSGSFGGKGELG